MEERTVICRVAGKEYPMALTLRATKAITERFGDLSELGDKLRAAGIAEQLDMVVWLLSLLIREGCDLWRYLHPEADTPGAPDEELLSVLLTPGDLVGMRTVIFHCLAVGMGRDVPIEDDGKNPEAGPETANSSPG